MKKIYLLILTFLFCASLFSQTGWIQINTGAVKSINDIFFINANTGWAVGDSTIIKTTNGGLNWVSQGYTYSSNIKNVFNSVRFINENTGYIAGGHYTGYAEYFYEYIYKTTNGGANWVLNHDQGGVNSVFTKVFPVSQNSVFATSAGTYMNTSFGAVSKSTNGGLNFVSGFTKGESDALYCLDSSTAWVSFFYWTDIISTRGYIYRTTNSGANWVEQYKDSLPNATKIKSLCFANQYTGYAVGQINSTGKQRFIKTTNGGAHWDTLSNNNSWYNSVYFVNENTGWIAGNWLPDSSCIAYTTNGGANWLLQKKGFSCIVTNLFFINSLTGWATISGSPNILKTTTGGVTFISNISNEIPGTYKLFQNYPNPFNPATKIKYQITKNNFVSLKVFDIIGKEIATLVNEKQSPGIYEVKFDAGDLPSGVYFCKISAGDFTGIKNMLLVK